MRILCEQEILNEAISIVSRAVSARSSLSVLEGIYIKATDDGKIKLTGNDMEIGIEAVVDAEVMQAGEVVINAKMLGGIIRSLAPGKVSLETNEKNQTLIKSGGAKFEIAGISADEFPDLPTVDADYSISLPGSLLKEMISKTGFAVADTDNNPILTGCLLEIENTGLTMVALDGYRLAMYKAKLENDFESKSMIIPQKSLTELARIIGDTDEEIRINATARNAIFMFDNIKMVTRLIEGNYINYNSVIPKDYSIEVECATDQLMDSIQRVSLIILNDVVKSPVKFNIGDGNINISCSTSAGNVDDNIPVDLMDAALEIGFYNRYLLEAIRAIDTENIRLKFNTPTSPLVIEPTDGDDFLYLILPLRLHAE
ncbi:MAG: DNA polymerase III subunit beta [Clostridia bacterium]|nr:DNA polymerase III subunit beta [Clostridia bacterium]